MYKLFDKTLSRQMGRSHNKTNKHFVKDQYTKSPVPQPPPQLTFNLPIRFFQERTPLSQTAYKASWFRLTSTPSGVTVKENATAECASAILGPDPTTPQSVELFGLRWRELFGLRWREQEHQPTVVWVILSKPQATVDPPVPPIQLLLE